MLRQKQLSIHKYTTNFRCFMCRGTHLDSIMVARGLTLGALILHNNLHTGAHYTTPNTAEIQHTLNTVQCKHMLILWWCKHIWWYLYNIKHMCTCQGVHHKALTTLWAASTSTTPSWNSSASRQVPQPTCYWVLSQSENLTIQCKVCSVEKLQSSTKS